MCRLTSAGFPPPGSGGIEVCGLTATTGTVVVPQVYAPARHARDDTEGKQDDGLLQPGARSRLPGNIRCDDYLAPRCHAKPRFGFTPRSRVAARRGCTRSCLIG